MEPKQPPMRFKRRFLLYAVLAGALAATTVAHAGVFEKPDSAEEAYSYGFPMIATSAVSAPLFFSPSRTTAESPYPSAIWPRPVH
jgi:hypothetical protein